MRRLGKHPITYPGGTERSSRDRPCSFYLGGSRVKTNFAETSDFYLGEEPEWALPAIRFVEMDQSASLNSVRETTVALDSWRQTAPLSCLKLKLNNGLFQVLTFQVYGSGLLECRGPPGIIIMMNANQRPAVSYTIHTYSMTCLRLIGLRSLRCEHCPDADGKRGRSMSISGEFANISSYTRSRRGITSFGVQ